jgi:hypothetical protein
MAEPLKYYHNITANVVNVMEGMQASSTRKVRASCHTLPVRSVTARGEAIQQCCILCHSEPQCMNVQLGLCAIPHTCAPHPPSSPPLPQPHITATRDTARLLKYMRHVR